MIKISVKKIYFDAIKCGIKTVEGRINNPKYQNLTLGMDILFFLENTKETILCTITGLAKYLTFKDMLQAEKIENMLPGIQTIEEGIRLYESFGDYKKEVEIYGAVAIKIAVKDSSFPQLRSQG